MKAIVIRAGRWHSFELKERVDILEESPPEPRYLCKKQKYRAWLFTNDLEILKQNK